MLKLLVSPYGKYNCRGTPVHDRDIDYPDHFDWPFREVETLSLETEHIQMHRCHGAVLRFQHIVVLVPDSPVSLVSPVKIKVREF